MDFDRLDAILKERKISRRKLALLAGINENTMSTAFRRKSGLNSEAEFAIAEALNLSPLYLMGLDNKRTSFEQHMTNPFDSAPVQYALENSVAIAISSVLVSLKNLNSLGRAEAAKRVFELLHVPEYTENATAEENEVFDLLINHVNEISNCKKGDNHGSR